MALRTIPIRRASNRPSLFMGGDRELVMCTAMLCAILVFTTQNWLAIILGIAGWVASLMGFRKMANADPMMRKIYQRNRRYKRYYAPRSTPFRKNDGLQGKQYK